MDSEQLRALQAPIKDRYRDDAGAARITLHSEGELGQADLACRVDTGRALVEAGLHPGAGGDGTQACSGNMLLDALVACAGVTLAAVATAMGITLRGGRIRAEGDLDFRGTLGVERSAPVGFSAIRLEFILAADEAPEVIERLIRTTERYCVIYQTLRNPPALQVAVQRA